MGVSHSTARLIAPLSFVYDFGAQQYGLLSTPSMKDIHDMNLAAFSPQPYFIGAFFFPQQIVQLVWLWRLWRGAGTRTELDEMADYAPWYALGNVCIGTWMFFWNANALKTSNVFVVVNTAAQLFYLATRLKRMDTRSTDSVLTHVVAKTFAGIGVLDLLHNSSAAYYRGVPPNTLTKVLTAVGFAGLASTSDWIFGGCLVYDLVALAVGQGGDWGRLLGAYAVGTVAIVGLRNWFIPPYDSKGPSYEPAGVDDYDEHDGRV